MYRASSQKSRTGWHIGGDFGKKKYCFIAVFFGFLFCFSKKCSILAAV
jgi:hypothetical protein